MGLLQKYRSYLKEERRRRKGRIQLPRGKAVEKRWVSGLNILGVGDCQRENRSQKGRQIALAPVAGHMHRKQNSAFMHGSSLGKTTRKEISTGHMGQGRLSK